MAACKFSDLYELGEPLGEGGFGIVKLGYQKLTGKKFAVKVVLKNRVSKPEQWQSEIRILQKLTHPNIVNLEECYESKNKVYIVMEYVEGGELFERITTLGRYTEEDARIAIRCIAEGVQYLHDSGVVHRDLKPENILLRSQDSVTDLKLVDFGLSHLVEEDQMLCTKVGTVMYMAPEMLLRKPYDSKVDMWSLGIISYILLVGYPPFYHENEALMIRMILNNSPDMSSPEWMKVSDGAKECISNLIRRDPKERYTAAQLLEHSWIVNKPVRDERHLFDAVSKLRSFNARRKRRFQEFLSNLKSTLMNPLRRKQRLSSISQNQGLNPLITPTIATLDPIIVPVGLETPVVLTGTNFSVDKMMVYVGGKMSQTVEVLSEGSLIFQVPAGMAEGTYSVEVVNENGQSSCLEDCFVISSHHSMINSPQAYASSNSSPYSLWTSRHALATSEERAETGHVEDGWEFMEGPNTVNRRRSTEDSSTPEITSHG
jgi:serine/threonine protein kinase